MVFHCDRLPATRDGTLCSLTRQHLPPPYLTVPLCLDPTDCHLQTQGALGHLGSQDPDASTDLHVIFGTLLDSSGVRDLKVEAV
ncbi:UNVERIFIED_CONTAM: hypothetical protein FKN15_068512 [Acipenser sinensis]